MDPFGVQIKTSAAALFESEDEYPYIGPPTTIKRESTYVDQAQEKIDNFEYSENNAPQIIQMKSYVEPSIVNPLSQIPEQDTRRGSLSDELTLSKRFLEDLDQIGTIFDQNLFEKINKVEHIKDTEC